MGLLHRADTETRNLSENKQVKANDVATLLVGIDLLTDLQVRFLA